MLRVQRILFGQKQKKNARDFFLFNAPGQVLFDQAGLGRGILGEMGLGGVPRFGGSNAGPPLGKSARRTSRPRIVGIKQEKGAQRSN